MTNDRRRSRGAWITGAALADWSGVVIALLLLVIVLVVMP